MPKRNFTREMTDHIESLKDPNDTRTKEERDNAFWDLAVGAFNQDIAGDVTFADGRTATINPIERVINL